MQYSRAADQTELEPILTSLDLENFFNVYTDRKQNYFFNLNSSLYLNVDKSILSKYVLTYNMYWTTISYMIYNTTRLAWLLMKLNNVNAINLFQMKKTGDIIYYLEKTMLNEIIDTINEER